VKRSTPRIKASCSCLVPFAFFRWTAGGLSGRSGLRELTVGVYCRVFRVCEHMFAIIWADIDALCWRSAVVYPMRKQL